MAAHSTDTHAQTVDQDRLLAQTEDLVGLGLAFPFFAALAVGQFFVDPRNQATGQRHAEVIHREAVATDGLGHFAVDIQNRTGRIGQVIGHCAVHSTHLLDQLAHVLCASAGGGLIGHGAHPLDHAGLEQAAQGHQHQAHGAVAADVILHAINQRLVDDLAVNRIQHDHRVVLHTQRRGGVDPVAIPTRFAQLGVNLVGVVAALAGENHLHGFEFINAVGVFQRCNAFANRRGFAACVGCGEKHRLDQIEVFFFEHALHQHGTDHATPTD